MRETGIKGLVRGLRTVTAIRAKGKIRAKDLLNRNFFTDTPNKVWITNFTDAPTAAGFTYVSFVIDLFSMRVLSWARMLIGGSLGRFTRASYGTIAPQSTCPRVSVTGDGRTPEIAQIFGKRKGAVTVYFIQSSRPVKNAAESLANSDSLGSNSIIAK